MDYMDYDCVLAREHRRVQVDSQNIYVPGHLIGAIGLILISCIL